MSLEDIEKRYAKGYDYTDREHRNQLYNDMEWLMDKVEQYKRDKEFDESIMQDYEKALQEKEEKIQQLETELMMLR